MLHRFGSFCAFVLVSLGATAPVAASSTGIQGFSGNPATQFGDSCNLCHAGGVNPTVVLSGPTTVEVGQTEIYTLTILSGSAAQDEAGLDVSATDGLLAVIEAGTRTGLNKLGQEEVTHTAPRAADFSGRTTFRFNWTAPLSAGSVTLYAAGNSVNGGQGSGGDAAGNDALTVTVEGGSSTPGETSGPALQPLRVTGYDAATGNLSLSYDVGCDATDNTIHYGPLDQVATHGWSGSDCAIGSGGAYTTFNPGGPGGGDVFFIVVGNDGAVEGSYGRIDPGAAPEQERPEYVGNACGQPQDLGNTCAEP